jgi:hypothetical protein
MKLLAKNRPTFRNNIASGIQWIAVLAIALSLIMGLALIGG